MIRFSIILVDVCIGGGDGPNADLLTSNIFLRETSQNKHTQRQIFWLYILHVAEREAVALSAHIFTAPSRQYTTMSSSNDTVVLQTIGHDLIQDFVAVTVETFFIGMHPPRSGKIS